MAKMTKHAYEPGKGVRGLVGSSGCAVCGKRESADVHFPDESPVEQWTKEAGV